MTWTWESYLNLLRKVGSTMESLAAVEREKTRAVCDGNLQAVDECMKREQAYSLTLRGYDIKREAAIKELGVEGVKLNRLAERAPEDIRLEAKQVAEETLRQYELFRTANQVAQSTLECNLREIEKAMAAQQTARQPAPVPPKPGENTPHKKTDFRA